MTRPKLLPTLATVLIGLLLITGLLGSPFAFLAWTLHDPRFDEQWAHVERGHELCGQQRWQQAQQEFEAALELGDDIYGVLGVATCTDHLGDYPGALVLFDRAIRMNPGWYQPYLDRARCMERNEGAAAVAAWYAELEQREQDVAKYRYLLGCHHKEFGRPNDALPNLHAALDVIMKRQGVTFTDSDQLAPPERIAVMEQNDLADLWPDVTDIAECYLEVGQLDLAWRWATRGVSLHQHLSRSEGYCSAEEIEAGDTTSRLLRARVHMRRSEWEGAERELAHARAFGDVWSVNQCEKLAKELAQRRGR